MASERSRKTDEQWCSVAKEEQIKIGQLLGIGDGMDSCTKDVLQSRIAVALYGLPETEDYSQTFSYKLFSNDKQTIVKKVADCIARNQPQKNPDLIIVGFILIYGKMHNSQGANFQQCVFRVPSQLRRQFKIIDCVCRVYKDWNAFLEENTLPKATICFPKDGIYKQCGMQVDFRETPAAGIKQNVLFGTDIASAVVGGIAGGALTLSLFVPMIAPVVWTAFGISAATGVYGMGRSIESLVERDQHQQSLSILDSEARSAWLGATLPVFGIAAQGGAVFLSSASRMGSSLTNVTKAALNVTNGLNCAAHALYFGSDLCNIVQSKVNDGEITGKQTFQCIASALLFANAVISTHQARMLLQTMPTNEPFSFLSNKPITTDGDIHVRPMNNVPNLYSIGNLSLVMKFITMVFDIPFPIYHKLETIFKYIDKCIETKHDTLDVITGLLTHIYELWDLFHKLLIDGKFNMEFPNSQSKENENNFRKIFDQNFHRESPPCDTIEILYFLNEKIEEEFLSNDTFKNNAKGKRDRKEMPIADDIKRNIILIPFFFTQCRIHTLYFAYPTSKPMNYHELIKKAIKNCYSFSLIEKKNYCIVHFHDTQSEYKMAFVAICQENKGLIILRLK